ncbi:immunoglobulin superfamily member 10-like [Oscarella lobularis]|uniref:immunoglobulin superfamily member 10-like n=1 Tax=Oscarella lobularis TaxID=121494 RepID=UPI003313FCF6
MKRENRSKSPALLIAYLMLTSLLATLLVRCVQDDDKHLMFLLKMEQERLTSRALLQTAIQKRKKTIEMCFYEPLAITVFQTDPHPSSCIPNHTSRDLQCKAAGSSLINLQILSQNNVTVSETHLSVATYPIADSSAALSGKYSCVAKGRYNNATKYFELIVFEPLTISNFEISSKDQTITISCSSTGLPVPTVQILDPHGEIVASGSNGTVVKSFASSTSASGNYTCYAKTSCGNASSSRHISFYESPRIVYFEAVYKKEQTCACVTKKSNVNVTCKATGFPPPQVAIVGPDGLSSSDKESVIEWNFPAKLPGNYTCKSRNKNGGADYESDKSVYICVSEPLEISLTSCIKAANSRVRGSCTCTGFPLPTVQILDPYNEVLASGKGTVEFSFLSNLTSVGKYTCKADNHCYSKTQIFSVCPKSGGLESKFLILIILCPTAVLLIALFIISFVFRQTLKEVLKKACSKRQPPPGPKDGDHPEGQNNDDPPRNQDNDEDNDDRPPPASDQGSLQANNDSNDQSD